MALNLGSSKCFLNILAEAQGTKPVTFKSGSSWVHVIHNLPVPSTKPSTPSQASKDPKTPVLAITAPVPEPAAEPKPVNPATLSPSEYIEHLRNAHDQFEGKQAEIKAQDEEKRFKAWQKQNARAELDAARALTTHIDSFDEKDEDGNTFDDIMFAGLGGELYIGAGGNLKQKRASEDTGFEITAETDVKKEEEMEHPAKKVKVEVQVKKEASELKISKPEAPKLKAPNKKFVKPIGAKVDRKGNVIIPELDKDGLPPSMKATKLTAAQVKARKGGKK